MGDALSLGELRAIVFAVCTLSFFAALVSWFPESFNYAEGREKVAVPSATFKGLSMIKYANWTEFNLTTPSGEKWNNTGGHDWVMNWQYDGTTDCIAISWMWLHWNTWFEDMGTMQWYDNEGNDVSLTGGTPWTCDGYFLGGNTHWITSSILNAVYDPATQLATFTVKNGAVQFELNFGYTGGYGNPTQAWIGGALQVLLGVEYSNTATQSGGVQLIFALLSFQSINGVPDSMAYLFGAFLWVLIAVIVMGLISRFIPFL